MKIAQNVRHFATKQALTLPVVSERMHDWLVDLHVDVFLEKADDDHTEERRARLEAFFDATIDMYLVALQEGYAEAEAREITHVVGSFDFYTHGWTEMMEFPADEVEAHYERYREFFDAHDISVENPLGEFAPADGLPDAPATPEKLDDGEFANAEAGYADDVYVKTADGDVKKGDRTDEIDA
ncbi:DUF6149 family protein [Salarchaeum japonicum]|uniref:DUF6149 family protein n=1 Tax=Salarchaeum japonicum TaxID=555573 RepID=A0AAV3SYR7_9EURY|nr:DUF6149 family protein [Salarchaeum japonicum]